MRVAYKYHFRRFVTDHSGARQTTASVAGVRRASSVFGCASSVFINDLHGSRLREPVPLAGRLGDYEESAVRWGLSSAILDRPWFIKEKARRMGGEIQGGYDRVAEGYAEQFRDELDRKPFDRKMLDWLAEKVGGLGVVCDMGCGPGQIARYLHSRGTKVCGVDLSPEMVRQASKLNPGINFRQGDMSALIEVEDNSYGGVAAFYSVVNLPRRSVVAALRELRRVLRPGGVLLLAFHVGEETKHLDEWLGEKVSMDFFFFTTEEVKGYLKAAGFELEEAIERDPYPEGVEYQSRRAYIFARKPPHG
jgi:SAM-dependent methyltransferase